MSSKTKGTKASASSNWLALQKVENISSICFVYAEQNLPLQKITATSSPTNSHPRKKRKIQHDSNRAASTSTAATTETHETTNASFSASFPRGAGEFTAPASTSRAPRVDVIKNGESVEALRKMVLGESKHTSNHAQWVPPVLLSIFLIDLEIERTSTSLSIVKWSVLG